MPSPKLIVIPAHSSSQRLPKKVLLEKDGITLLEHTYRQAMKTGKPVLVASGDRHIDAACEKAGMSFVQVREQCCCGTERVAIAVSRHFGEKANPKTLVINWQADWPTISPATANVIFECLEESPTIDVYTAAGDLSEEDKENRNAVKVSISFGKAYRFSRKPTSGEHIYHHQGIYGFKLTGLGKCAQLNTWLGSKAENLEQTTWLAHGNTIGIVMGMPAKGIDSMKEWEEFSSSQPVDADQVQSGH